MFKRLSWIFVAWIAAACGSMPRGELVQKAAAERPKPPADLDQRLLVHYPLRGLVLRESGFARVRFTVTPEGAISTGELLSKSHAAYARACRNFLEQSTWSPARDAAGNPVAFTGTFDCAFEYPGETAARDVLSEVVQPPVQPDYGSGWFARFTDDGVARDTGAELYIEVAVDGAVSVTGELPGSHPLVADACRVMLSQGPRWQPARNAAGAPVLFRGTFSCKVEIESRDLELSLENVGAAGALSVEQVAAALAEHLHAFTHCFESAASMSKPIRGQHWLAFEIDAEGRPGRAEWVDAPLEDELLDRCVFSALRELSFPAGQSSTLGDVQLDVGATMKLRFTL